MPRARLLRPPHALPLLLALAACGAPGAADPGSSDPSAVHNAGHDAGLDALPPVRVAEVVADERPAALEATGTLGPRDLVPLSFSVGGVVQAVSAEPGERVAAGARLATLDLREIDARVRQATEAMEKAERDLARLERLHADRVVPLAQLQDARTGHALAAAALDEARVNREFAEIRAPEAGVILRRLAEAGERVQPGTAILLLGGSDAEVFRVGLSDRERMRVAPGDRAEVLLDAGSGAPLPGRITRLGGAPDPGTGTFPAEITLDLPSGAPSGLVGRARIFLAAPATPTAQASPAAEASPPPLLRMAVEALLDGDHTQGRVLVHDPVEGRVHLRVVTLARSGVGPLLGEGTVGVTAGLAPGEQVVVEGGAWLAEGQRVRVLP